MSYDVQWQTANETGGVVALDVIKLESAVKLADAHHAQHPERNVYVTDHEQYDAVVYETGIE